MGKIEFYWKPITEVPTERWERNKALSPWYLVKLGTNKYGVSILGYSQYSFVSNEWLDCCFATEEGLWKVQAWTNVKI